MDHGRDARATVAHAEDAAKRRIVRRAVGAVVVVVELLAVGFALFVHQRRGQEKREAVGEREPVRRVEPVQAERGGMPFVVKVILACVIVVLFFKYVVQLQLQPVVTDTP